MLRCLTVPVGPGCVIQLPRLFGLKSAEVALQLRSLCNEARPDVLVRRLLQSLRGAEKRTVPNVAGCGSGRLFLSLIPVAGDRSDIAARCGCTGAVATRSACLPLSTLLRRIAGSFVG